MNSQQLIQAIRRGTVNEEVISLALRRDIQLSAANRLKVASVLLTRDKTTARNILQLISVDDLCRDIQKGAIAPELITLASKIWKSSKDLRVTIFNSTLAPTPALMALVPLMTTAQLEKLARDELRLLLAPELIDTLLTCGRLDKSFNAPLQELQNKIREDEQMRLRNEFTVDNMSDEIRDSLIEEKEDVEDEIDESSNIYSMLKKMTIAERARLAQKANKSVRLLLVKDSNRLVARSVMRSPRLTESDVEQIAKTREVDEDVLRIISQNKLWMRKYSITKNLAFNPRTPLAVSMTLTKNLSNNDIKSGSRDHNIPAALRQFITKVAQKRGLR
jgi:hypothetical protein